MNEAGAVALHAEDLLGVTALSERINPVTPLLSVAVKEMPETIREEDKAGIEKAVIVGAIVSLAAPPFLAAQATELVPIAMQMETMK